MWYNRTNKQTATNHETKNRKIRKRYWRHLDTDMCNNMHKIGRTFGDYAGLSAAVLCTLRVAVWRNHTDTMELLVEGICGLTSFLSSAEMGWEGFSMTVFSFLPIILYFRDFRLQFVGTIALDAVAPPHPMDGWGTSPELPEAVVRGEEGEQEWCQNSSLGCALLVNSSDNHPFTLA